MSIRVIHIITGLNTGGAEMMLFKLLLGIRQYDCTHEVISLTDIGPLGEKITSLGVRVRAMGMQLGSPNPLMLLKLSRWVKQAHPDAIQTWMYHADLMGGLAAKFAGGIPVAWGIHNANLDLRYNNRLTVWTVRLCSILSKWLPTKIVYVSDGARKVHEQVGYVAVKTVVIPNGIDTSLFKPHKASRLSVRQELGIDKNTFLIGLVARFDPQKDHRNFIKAAKQLCAVKPHTHFVLCGYGIDWNNQALASWIDGEGLRDCFHLLGVRDDISRITSALDIASSSSFGESFALTVGEAMACGIPCVITDIEGPVSLLGGFGWVVPIGDEDALCKAWQEVYDTPKELIEKRIEGAKRRIEGHFSLPLMVMTYHKLFLSLAGNV